MRYHEGKTALAKDGAKFATLPPSATYQVWWTNRGMDGSHLPYVPAEFAIVGKTAAEPDRQ